MTTLAEHHEFQVNAKPAKGYALVVQFNRKRATRFGPKTLTRVVLATGLKPFTDINGAIKARDRYRGDPNVYSAQVVTIEHAMGSSHEESHTELEAAKRRGASGLTFRNGSDKIDEHETRGLND